MTRQAQLLLLDLLKLKVKYEDEVLNKVRQVLEFGEDEFLSDTLKLLQSLHKDFPVSDQVVSPRKKVVNTVAEPPRTLPPLLGEIKQLLESKDTFPTVKHLRDYVKAHVPSTKGKDSKSIVIEKYMEFLSGKPETELEEVRNELVTITKKDVKKFMGMAKSIVDARGKKK